MSPNDGSLHPVYYMSRKTIDAVKRTQVTNCIYIPVIGALKKFRAYFLGLHFKIVTDCNAFAKTTDKKDICTRVAM